MLKKLPIFDFMSKRKTLALISAFLILASIASIFINGLNLGLDFTGGTAVELVYAEDANLVEIRKTLKDSEFAKAQVQNYGDSKTVLVKIIDAGELKNKSLGKDIEAILKETASSGFEVKRVDFIGPAVGEELRDQSGMAGLVAMFIILAYVAVRFSFKFALGAIAALFHDVIFTLGFFSFFQLTFDLTVLAAVLAVMGYSLNDTIVVSDRIRENFKAARLESPVSLVNTSLNQMLGRTLITSLTTLFVLLALFVMGGEALKGFSSALIVGVMVGTYSSIYVASNILLTLNINKKDFIEIQPEAADAGPVDLLP